MPRSIAKIDDVSNIISEEILEMANLITDLTDGIRRLQKLNKDVSELELREEALALRELLMSVKEELLEKSEKIRELEEKIKTLSSGDGCPICNEGTLKVTAVKPHPQFAFAGRQVRTVVCTNCKHTEQRDFSPRDTK